MSKNDISALEKKLVEADRNYHTFGFSDMSDAEYDSLKDRLRVLDPTNKLLTKVGHTVSVKTEKEHWKKGNHGDFKMGSQNKVTTNDGLKKWMAKYANELFVVQHKLDGASIKLHYEDGKLVSAISRGEGCIDFNSLIEFENGDKIKIGDCVQNKICGKVKCFNTDTKEIEYCEIKDWYDNGNSDNWYEISYKDSAGNIKTLIITGDHLVWLPNLNCYRKVKDLTDQDYISINISP